VTEVTDAFVPRSYRGGMKANLAVLDRILRLVLVAAIAVLYFVGVLPTVAAIILGVLALVFLVTSIVGWCPLYALLGISTKKKAA
jgi:uncharacterized membrane protein